jgi:hypothetical protein
VAVFPRVDLPETAQHEAIERVRHIHVWRGTRVVDPQFAVGNNGLAHDRVPSDRTPRLKVRVLTQPRIVLVHDPTKGFIM